MPRKSPAPPNALLPAQIILGIIGAAFILFGLPLLYFLGQDSRLECSRTDSVHCSIVVRWMGLAVTSTHEIVQPKTAWVDRTCDTQGCTYRVMIASAQGDVPLTDSYFSDDLAIYANAKQINTYIAGDQLSNLTLQTSDQLWIILPLVFVVLGVLILLLAFRGLPRLLKAARGD
jgi:hypothetical protein